MLLRGGFGVCLNPLTPSNSSRELLPKGSGLIFKHHDRERNPQYILNTKFTEARLLPTSGQGSGWTQL